MSTGHSAARGAHLVGSLNVADAEAAFRLAGDLLGRHLRRFPDGETGERRNWVGAQLPALLNAPELELSSSPQDAYPSAPQVRLRSAASGRSLRLGNLGIARAAISSYQVFAQLRSEGALPPAARFQIGVPSPLALICTRVERDSRSAVEAAYLPCLRAELAEVFAAIPATELAVQWELPVEIGILEGVFEPFFAGGRPEIVRRIASLAEEVPQAAEVGFHFCYGDAGGTPFARPESLKLQTDLLEDVLSTTDRPLAWAHLAVPSGSASEDFLAPLSGLAGLADVEIYLGLIDPERPEASRAAIETASALLPAFGVACSCGLGRRDAHGIRSALALHADIARPID